MGEQQHLILWVPGLGKVLNLFPQSQATKKVGHRLGLEEGFWVMIRVCKLIVSLCGHWGRVAGGREWGGVGVGGWPEM